MGLVIAVAAIVSCKKQYSTLKNVPAGNERKIRFQLYTNQDFSGDNSRITFSIFIRHTNVILFDSTFASMQIKDIPDAAHKLVIEKTVSGNDNTDLAAGFRYEIENVGFSGFIDTSKAGNPLKIIDYAFQ